MHKGKILVIDDEVNILKTIELSLSSYGYSPEVFANPLDGLARAKTVFLILLLLI
jgi:DNA-binding response OmpR family regulator